MNKCSTACISVCKQKPYTIDNKEQYNLSAAKLTIQFRLNLNLYESTFKIASVCLLYNCIMII